MKKDVIVKLTKSFEDTAQTHEGVEFWLARDIQALLEYDRWENFSQVIEKAKIACQKSGHKLVDHFADVGKMIEVAKGAQREVQDMMLSRYACYLIAQNGDPRKETIAFAQTYFAIQTRKQELLEERLKIMERIQARKKLSQTEKELSSTLYEHGVDDLGFARIRSKGDEALFGGRSTAAMKKKLAVPDSRALADFLPTITIKAKDFAGEITHEHVKNNSDVRQVLIKSNIYPEELPPEEDVKKLERRVKNIGTPKELPKKGGR